MRLEGALFQVRFLIEQLSLHCLGLLFLLLLPLDIFPNLFFIQSNGAHTVPLRPQVTPPIIVAQDFRTVETIVLPSYLSGIPWILIPHISAESTRPDAHGLAAHSIPLLLPVLFAYTVDTLVAWHIRLALLWKFGIDTSDRTQYDTCTRTTNVIAF